MASCFDDQWRPTIVPTTDRGSATNTHMDSIFTITMMGMALTVS